MLRMGLGLGVEVGKSEIVEVLWGLWGLTGCYYHVLILKGFLMVDRDIVVLCKFGGTLTSLSVFVGCYSFVRF